MRRASLILGLAAVLVAVFVGTTYLQRKGNTGRARNLPPVVKATEDGLALEGWSRDKDDPEMNHPVYRLKAASFRATNNPSAFELHGLILKLYSKKQATYTYVKADEGYFDERSGILTAHGPVRLVIDVPVDKDAESKDELAKRVQVATSDVVYETKTYKAATDKAASFVFPDGSGKCVGMEYDPSIKTMHMKSQVVLDRNGMHVESGDLVYKEAEQKIYLSPWSKMQRQTLTIQAQSSVVLLENRKVHRIEAEHPAGIDDRKGRHVEYSAEHMTALFNDEGVMTQVLGDRNARVVSTQKRGQTVITGDRADLHFAQETKSKNGKEAPESYLDTLTAEGHAVAESSPVDQPGVVPAQTRILRSERIELAMKPGGQEVKEIVSPTKAQLEFKPNRPEQVHRVLDASRMRIVYGDHSYVDTFFGWNVKTRTDKPAKPNQKGDPAPAYTWSDEMTAKFVAGSNDIATIDQRGHFRYEEGARQASASKALLEQKTNRITLTDHARVSDDTGSTSGDLIVMDQTSGDMDVTGNVLSVRKPEKNQKPGTSMLDQTQPMQAKADKMRSRDENYSLLYEGHAVMWQAANRLSADKIAIDRDEQTLHASGHVVSEVVDNKGASSTIYTTVKAPEMIYHDDTREALYTGGVTLLRNAMTVNSNELRAFLTPKTDDKGTDSSLDHAFADGDMTVVDVLGPNHTRTGKADRGEYYTKEDKVVLTGGAPQLADNLRGVTKGKLITYFSGDDRLLVEGETKKPAFTKMTKSGH